MKAYMTNRELKLENGRTMMSITFITNPVDVIPNPCELTIQEYSPERNVDQNARYWVIVSEIAKIMGVSKTEIHNGLLYDYGELELKDGNPIEVMMPESYDYLSDRDLHLAPTGEMEMIDGKPYVKYYKLLDSKHMTKKSFSNLIEGAKMVRAEL